MQSAHHESQSPIPDKAGESAWPNSARSVGFAWTTRLPLIVLALVIFAVAFYHYRSEVGTTAFHPDESRWVNRAHYIEDLADPFGPTWNDQYLTRGQPPIGSYVMGIGLWIQGVDLDTNYAWEYRRSGDWNVQNGMYPTPDDLRAGRMVNVFLGSVAVVMTFFVVRLLSNTAGGIVGAAVLTFHPLQAWHNRLALADTTLTLTLAAISLMTILLLRRPGWFRAIALGILIGIGGANKLTPMALAFVLAGAGALMLIGAFRRDRRALLPVEPWHRAIPGAQHLSWMLISMPVLAGATFVAVYPYLWASPISRTLLLIDFRRNEMDAQSRLYPQFAVETTGEAITKTWESLAQRWSATEWLLDSWGLPGLGAQLSSLDMILAITGATALALVGIRLPLRSGHLVVGLLLLVEVGTIVFSMRTDFERYYLPIVLAIAIFAGSGVGIATRLLVVATQLRRHASEHRQIRSWREGNPQAGVSEP